MKQLYSYEFDKFRIDFEFETKENVMVNATQMAKIFGKRVDFFLKSDHAKEFIKVIEFTPYGGNPAPLTRDEIIQTNHKTGTWMNRILAIKFAAWLSPAFELWVYSTIDELLFGHYKELEASLKNSAKYRTTKEDLHAKLLVENPDYKEMVELDEKDKREITFRRKFNAEQLDIFSSAPN